MVHTRLACCMGETGIGKKKRKDEFSIVVLERTDSLQRVAFFGKQSAVELRRQYFVFF